VTSQTCPPLASEAVNVQEKFETLVLLFAVCYFKYNSTKPIDDVALDTLGTTHLRSFQTNIQHTQRVNIINSLYFIKFFITENDIKELMPYFCAKFQAATFPPKMHMLEEHTVPFMRKWKSLLGFFREQGGDSTD